MKNFHEHARGLARDGKEKQLLALSHRCCPAMPRFR